jgi:hypothetical protein
VGHRVGLDGCGKSRHQPRFDPRTVQPVASRYTDYIAQRVVVIYYRRFGTTYWVPPSRFKNPILSLGFLNPEDVTDGLSRNVGKELPILAA